MIAEPTGTDGFRVLCHQFFPSSLPRLATCLSGFKNVCQRAQAFASQLLPLQRLCHLPSKYLMLFLQATDFRTDILSAMPLQGREEHESLGSHVTKLKSFSGTSEGSPMSRQRHP